jgi:RNA polymerase sigma factor (sigma-70 family)
MARLRGAQCGLLMQQLGRLFLQGSMNGSSEGELLDRFVRGRDESAFEALVARHGPMVLSVCRQLLHDPNDVDDAFQATFLVLVRKAGTLRRCDLLGNWLYGVAYRVALRARSLSARRAARFGSAATVENLADPDWSESSSTNSDILVKSDRAPWLHQEVSYLPEKYRTPIVLCYFEGLTHDEAASRLGWPLGTVKGRLSRARDLLRRRLIRRGVTLPAAALAAELMRAHAEAAVPAALEMSVTRAAISLISNAGISIARASFVSIPVTTLAEGVLQTMVWNQVKLTAASLLLAGTLATGVVVGAIQATARSGDGGESEVTVQGAGLANLQRGGGSGSGAGRGGLKAKAAGAATDQRQKTINLDLSSQIGEAKKSFDQMLSRLRDPGIADIDRLSTWSSLMLSADLVLGSTPEDGAAARAAHRDRMKKLHEFLKKLPASAKNQTVNANHAEEKLREAEFLLENDGNSMSGAGMMGQMGAMMGGMQRMGGGRGGSGMAGMMGGMMRGVAEKKGKDVRSAARVAKGEAAESPSAGTGAMGRMMGAMGGGMAMGSGAGGAMGGGMSGMSGMAGGAAGMGGQGAAMGGMGGGAGDHRGRVLSLALASTATELAIRDKNPKSKVVLKKLEEPIAMSFIEEAPLEDVLKYIKQASTTNTYGGLPIYVDPSGLQAVDKTMTSTVRHLDLEGIPLKATLRILLRQLGLAYCVRDGVVIISSPQLIFDELREAQQELDTAKEIKETEGESTEGGASDGESESRTPQEASPAGAAATKPK